MNDRAFPYEVGVLIELLTKVFKTQKRPEIVALLHSAKPRIELTDWDNWNGGIGVYTLFLEISIEKFALIESEIEETENLIADKARTLLRSDENHQVGRVTISPCLSEEPLEEDPAEIEEKGKHLWKPGMFRLFLSHVSRKKKEVSQLRDALSNYGVSAFVAHEDIEPIAVWQIEIINALLSMDALAALLTEGFKESNWTDQEVGIALGRGTFILPIRLGVDPYGFIGKQQALSGNLKDPEVLAGLIVDLLLRHDRSASKMRDALVTALELSGSFSSSIAISKKLSSSLPYTYDQIQGLRRALKKNKQVNQAFGVSARIQEIEANYKKTNS